MDHWNGSWPPPQAWTHSLQAVRHARGNRDVYRVLINGYPCRQHPRPLQKCRFVNWLDKHQNSSLWPWPLTRWGRRQQRIRRTCEGILRGPSLVCDIQVWKRLLTHLWESGRHGVCEGHPTGTLHFCLSDEGGAWKGTCPLAFLECRNWLYMSRPSFGADLY